MKKNNKSHSNVVDLKINFKGHLQNIIFTGSDKFKHDITEQKIEKPITILSTEKIIGSAAVRILFKLERW